jgi:MYXO-CTERM domain-containing protein
VARDAGGNVTSIQFLPDSVLIFDNVVGIIVPLGLFGTVEAQLLDVQIALANQTLVPGGFELSADSPIPVVPAGIDPLTGDDLYTGNVAGQGATVITGTAILQGTNPTDPIYGFFDPITGRSEIDLVDPFGPFLEFAPGTLEVVDGDTKVYNIRFDFSGFIDNLISEPSLRLTSDLTITSRVVAVPEAGSMTMVALAMGGLGLAAFRRRRQG